MRLLVGNCSSATGCRREPPPPDPDDPRHDDGGDDDKVDTAVLAPGNGRLRGGTCRATAPDAPYEPVVPRASLALAKVWRVVWRRMEPNRIASHRIESNRCRSRSPRCGVLCHRIESNRKSNRTESNRIENRIESNRKSNRTEPNRTGCAKLLALGKVVSRHARLRPRATHTEDMRQRRFNAHSLARERRRRSARSSRARDLDQRRVVVRRRRDELMKRLPRVRG